MKNQTKLLLLLVFMLPLCFISCKKDKTEVPSTSSQTYIKCNLNGAAKSFTATGSDTYSYPDEIETYVGTSDNGIMVFAPNFNKDTLASLVGRKLPIRNSGPDSDYSGRVFFTDGSTDYDTNDASTNPFPANFFRITKITFIKSETILSIENSYYLAEGDFNANAGNGSSDVALTNGTFKLVVLITAF